MQEFKVHQCSSELIYYHLCKTLVKIRLCNLITSECIVNIIHYFFFNCNISRFFAIILARYDIIFNF